MDLAWAGRRQSGLAELSAEGDLITLTQAVSDDELLGWLRPRAAGPVLVAFDAPLVVVNDAGSRSAERAVGHHFGRFHASCHPANRSNPMFADGGRAHRLALAMALDINPFSVGSRRALEVYPHPAIVMMFGLPSILRYKNKRHHSFEVRQDALVDLMGRLEGLATAAVPMRVTKAPEWSRVRGQVESATTKAALSRAEDSIDAVVCAYVGLYSVRRPELTAVLGAVNDGAIVIPVTEAVREQVLRDRERGWPASMLDAAD